MFKGDDEDRASLIYSKANRGRWKPDVYGKTQITSEPQGEYINPCRSRTVTGGAYYTYAGGTAESLRPDIGRRFLFIIGKKVSHFCQGGSIHSRTAPILMRLEPQGVGLVASCRKLPRLRILIIRRNISVFRLTF